MCAAEEKNRNKAIHYQGGVNDIYWVNSLCCNFTVNKLECARVVYALHVSGYRPHLPGTVGDQSMAKPSVMCPEKLKRLVASFCLLVKAAMAAALWMASIWGRRSNISTCPFSDHTAASDWSPCCAVWKSTRKTCLSGPSETSINKACLENDTTYSDSVDASIVGHHGQFHLWLLFFLIFFVTFFLAAFFVLFFLLCAMKVKHTHDEKSG